MNYVQQLKNENRKLKAEVHCAVSFLEMEIIKLKDAIEFDELENLESTVDRMERIKTELEKNL